MINLPVAEEMSPLCVAGSSQIAILSPAFGNRLLLRDRRCDGCSRQDRQKDAEDLLHCLQLKTREDFSCWTAKDELTRSQEPATGFLYAAPLSLNL